MPPAQKRMIKCKLKLLTLVWILLNSVSLLAQVEKIRIVGTNLNLRISGTLSGNLIDTTGNYSDKALQVGFSIPVYQNIAIGNKDQELSMIIISVNSRTIIRKPEIDFLKYNGIIYAPSAGLSLFAATSNKNYWFLSANASLSGDINAISITVPRFEGSGIYIRRVNPGFSYHVGAAYSFAFGRGLILPLIGMREQFAEQFIFNCTLPLSVSFKYYVENTGTFFSLFLKPAGNSAILGNGSNWFGLNDKLWLQNRQLFAGAGTRVKLVKELFLSLDGGFLTGRKIAFSKNISGLRSENMVFQSGVANTAFFQLGVVYKFLPNRYTNYLKNDEVDWFQGF
jgi:hypothetical protein